GPLRAGVVVDEVVALVVAGGQVAPLDEANGTVEVAHGQAVRSRAHRLADGVLERATDVGAIPGGPVARAADRIVAVVAEAGHQGVAGGLVRGLFGGDVLATGVLVGPVAAIAPVDPADLRRLDQRVRRGQRTEPAFLALEVLPRRLAG